MEQWQFSQMTLSNKTAEKSLFLANHKQESKAYKVLSGEAVTLISCLVFLNTTLDWQKILKAHFRPKDIFQEIPKH